MFNEIKGIKMTLKNSLKSMLRKVVSKNVFDMIAYSYIFKRIPSINNPRYFNEKIIKRKHLDKNYLYSYCSNKVDVRSYVKEKIGGQYLIPVVLITDNPEDIIELDVLDKCVVKLNTGSGFNIIEPNVSTDKKRLKVLQTLNSWMTIDIGGENECQYDSIKRRIIVEESLCLQGKVPSDYKFHCFKQKDGTVKFVLQMVNGRFSEESRGYFVNTLYDCSYSLGQGEPRIPKEDISTLQKICQLNEVLCEHFNYVRLDWYVVDGKPYFGEMTFTPGGGLSKEFGLKLELIMGEMWEL